MLLTKKIKIKVVSNQCKRYKELGYVFKCNDVIEIDIKDLPLKSNIRVDVKCDSCGKEYTLQYYDYNKIKGETICKNCKCEILKKRKETCIERYGVDNPFKDNKFRTKQKETIMSKYGCENVFQNEDIKNKIKQSMILKYGVSHPMYSKEIKDVVFEKSIKTMSQNGTQVSSKNQSYINKLYGGDLNYLFDKLWIDIFFEKENIYFEYDGSGHDIDVKYHKLTTEEFRAKEIKRNKFLHSKGLLEFRIISKRDIIPNDEILLQIKSFAFYILLNKISNYIIFDIDNQIIKFQNNTISYNYTDIFGFCKYVL